MVLAVQVACFPAAVGPAVKSRAGRVGLDGDSRSMPLVHYVSSTKTALYHLLRRWSRAKLPVPKRGHKWLTCAFSCGSAVEPGNRAVPCA